MATQRRGQALPENGKLGRFLVGYGIEIIYRANAKPEPRRRLTTGEASGFRLLLSY